MKVSVIIPCYNAAIFIERAVRSVLEQTYRDLELLVIDDGSKDESVSIVNRLITQDERLVLIRNEVNAGLPITINKGIRESSGEFVCFLGADDIFLPSRIEKMVHAMDRRPGAFAYTDVFTITEDDKVIRRSYSSHIPPDGKSAHGWFLCNEAPGYSGIMLSRDHIKRIGFYDESLKWAEDLDYVLRLSRQVETSVVREPLYGYRKHGASSTSKHAERWRRETDFAVLSKHLEISKSIIDDETRFKSIRRVLRYAKGAKNFAGYAKWAADPVFLKVAARKALVRKK